jgi:hypothetical protein
MNSLETYRLFLGINNHFFKPSYDYFKYGPVPVKPETFEDKPHAEKFRYERLSQKFSEKEDLENFMVSNAIDCKKKMWVGDLFGGEADRKYTEWRGRTNPAQAQYNAVSQIKRLVEQQDGFNKLFVTPGSGQHPEILKAHLRGDLTIETFVLLDMCVNFFPRLDKDLGEDRTWFVLKNKSVKYRPFLNRLNIPTTKLCQNILNAVQELGVSG